MKSRKKLYLVLGAGLLTAAVVPPVLHGADTPRRPPSDRDPGRFKALPESADNGRRADLSGTRPAPSWDPNRHPRTPEDARDWRMIPNAVLAAYKAAERTADPECGLDWETLAGIGKVESGHALNGRVDEKGNVVQPILGPLLDGEPFAAIPDTDDARLDGDRRWDRAVGPMQLIPGAWRRFEVDGNRDGIASPDNVYDAAAATGRYLCFDDADLSRRTDLVVAVYRYNHSMPYVMTTLAWIDAYRKNAAKGNTPNPAGPEKGDGVVAGPGAAPPGEPSRSGPAPAPPAPQPSKSPSPSPSPSRPPSPSPPPPTPPPSPWCPIGQQPIGTWPPVCVYPQGT